jgi:aspartyl-tRNA(Asn)/glutamyl-tRNA(Gln) amidotransferase subunit A
MIPPEVDAAPATIGSLAAELATGAVTARQVCERALHRAADPAGQGPTAFVHLDADTVLAMADAMDAARADASALAALAGIPIAIKDLFDVAGEDTRAGSRDVLVAAAPADALAVARLRAAGMIPFGRANMTEFAYSGLGQNPHHGTPLSPWRRNEARIAGGSTSGGAVAVADGIVPAALGSDTGGSCRIPAAFCGLVGFKPTSQRIPREGMIPLSTTLDSVGWITNSVSCAIALDAVLAQTEPAPVRAGIVGARLLVPANIVLDDADPAISDAFAVLCTRLRAAGVEIVTIPLPSIDRIAAINAGGGFTAAESFAFHRGIPPERFDRYDPRVRQRIQRGSLLSAADYIDMLNARRELIAAFDAEVAGYDAVLFPSVPILPPRLADLADDDAFGRINLLALRNSTIVNMVDGCAINLPLPCADGPAGFTLAGSGGRDAAILGLAAAMEAFFAAD